jgi:hypothetical protein
MAKAFDPKAKAKRQKIIAAVGAVILVALLVWRVPQVIALMNKKPPPAPVSSSTPAPATPALPTTAPAPGGATSGATLVNTDVAPTPEAGQLVSFDRFVSKDPFAQQLRPSGSGSASGSGSGGKPHKPVKTREPELDVVPPPPPAPKPVESAPEGAQISVDGKAETVAVGGVFPADNPLFKLVSVSTRSAKIAIEGGSYASGAATLTLKRGKAVTLLNTADGSRYTVKLL